MSNSKSYGKLSVKDKGENNIGEYEIQNGETTVGRKAGEPSSSKRIYITDKIEHSLLSRKHFIIKVSKHHHGYYIYNIKDANSTNGTIIRYNINGNIIEKNVGDTFIPLEDNSTIYAGEFEFHFKKEIYTCKEDPNRTRKKDELPYSPESVLYVKAQRNNVETYIDRGKSKPTIKIESLSLKNFKSKYEEYNYFLQISRSLLVNKNKITGYRSNDKTLILTNGINLKISRSYTKDDKVMNFLSEFLRRDG